MSRNWSQNQLNVFSFIENADGNAIIEAVAGSGKSTTIVEGMNRVRAGANTIFLAFNKTIAEELKSKGVNARTFHSLTYMPVLRSRNVNTVTADKLRKLVDANFNGEDRRLYGRFAEKLVGLARQAGIGCLVRDEPQAWMDIVIYHDLELESDEGSLDRAIDMSVWLFDLSYESQMVDFDDLLYLAVRDGVSLPKFDFVFVDEAQDTNSIQRAILRKILHPASRLIAVGDPAQAIYGFRGADSNSLNLIAEEFACKRLPLTVSYRCPTSVVKYARNWVDHIEPAPGAPEGSVYENFAWNMSTFHARDLIVCRTTKPIVQLGYRLLQARVPVRILGKEIGQGLQTLVKKMKSLYVDEMMEKLAVWEARESEKARARGNDAKVESITDKADCIRCLVDGMDESNRTIEHLLNLIDTLFNGSGDVVTLCTIHKAKGLESRRVFWLNRSTCPARWARQEWQQQQERNLCYVATTRAIEELYTIEL